MNCSVNFSSDDYDPQEARVDALVRLRSFAQAFTDPALGNPHGFAQVSWRNYNGLERVEPVTLWRRLDGGLMRAGDVFQVSLEARQYNDLRLPLFSATAQFQLTLQRDDVSTLDVGDLCSPRGWRFGVRVVGAVLLPNQRFPRLLDLSSSDVVL